MLSIFFFYGGMAVLFLRLSLGGLFLAHGVPKLKDLKLTAENFALMGFRPGRLWATVVGLLETFGGIALILGLLTQSVAALFVIQFVVIIVKKLMNRRPFVGGWELDLMVLAGVVVLLFLGAGSYSFDRVFPLGWL
jgi:putative oxidoreductase